MESVEDIKARVQQAIDDYEEDLTRLRAIATQAEEPDVPGEKILQYEEAYNIIHEKAESVKRKWFDCIDLKKTAHLVSDDHAAIANIRRSRQYQQEYELLAKEESEAYKRFQDALHAKRMKPIHDFQQALAPVRIDEIEAGLAQAKGTLAQIDRLGDQRVEEEGIRSSTFIDLTVSSSEDTSL